jgi:hypothetical protein
VRAPALERERELLTDGPELSLRELSSAEADEC